MRNLKKVLVMVLALAMMLSIMVVGAGAVPEAFTDVKDIDDTHKEAVEMATQLNIIEGFPDKSFQPKGDVTRAQIAKMICKAINAGEEPATAVKADPSYNDIKGHWAEGFIEYCTAKGIIAGYPDGSFKPEQPVTGAEAAKMMLVALGYNADVENYVGDDWDLYVNVQANQDGLYVDLLDVADLTTTNLTREHTAQMVWNMLQAYTIKQTSSIDKNDGSVSLNYAKSNSTLFWESYRGILGDGILKGFKHSDGKWTYYVDFDSYYYVDNGGNQKAAPKTVEVKATQDYTDWLGHSVKVAFNADDRNATFKASNNTAYGIFHDEGANLVTAQFGDLGKIKPGDNTIDIDGKTYRMDDGMTVSKLPVYEFVNGAKDLTPYEPVVIAGTTTSNVVYTVRDSEGKEYTIYGAPITSEDSSAGKVLYQIAGEYYNSALNKTVWQTRWDHQKFTAVDQDEDGQIDFLLVTPYDVAQVTAVNGSKVTLNVLDPGTGTYLDDSTYSKDKQFLEDVEAYEGIQRDDWVIYTHDKNTLNDKATLVKAETITGEITAANDRTPNDTAKATIGGVQYTFSNYFDTTMGITSELCKVGNRLDNAVVVNNYIFAVDYVKKAAITDYALVVSAGYDQKDGNWAKVLFWNSKKPVTVATDIDYTDYFYVNGKYTDEGVLVTYSKNSDDEYILKQTNPYDTNGGYKVDRNVTDGEKISNNKTTVGYLWGRDVNGNFGKATINSDAVIFVRYQKAGATDYSYKVITGAQLKLNDNEKITIEGNKEINSRILGSRIKNTDTVELAYVDIYQWGVEDSTTLYGYVTDEAAGMTSSPVDGDTVRQISLYTVNGDETLYFADTIKALRDGDPNDDISVYDSQYKAIVPGMVVAYKQNEETKEITEIVGFYNVNGTSINGNSYSPTSKTDAYTVAITAANSNPLAFNGGWDTVNGRFWDTDEAVILCVDTANDVGVATKLDKLPIADKDNTGASIANAFVLYNNVNAAIDLIIVDSENDISGAR